MHGGGTSHGRVPPRHRTVQRPVELEHARPVPVTRQHATVAGRQPVAGDFEHLSWGQVEQYRRCRWQLGERAHRGGGGQFPAEPAQPSNQGVRKCLGSTDRDRPPDVMGQQREEQPIPTGDGLAQVEHGMGGAAAEQRAAAVTAQRRLGENGRRPQPAGTEPGQGDRRRGGQIERGKHICRKAVAIRDERSEQPAPPRPGSKARVGPRDVAVQERRRPVVERMRERHHWMRPAQALVGQRHRAQRG